MLPGAPAEGCRQRKAESGNPDRHQDPVLVEDDDGRRKLGPYRKKKKPNPKEQIKKPLRR
jgi:hypothetical protein